MFLAESGFASVGSAAGIRGISRDVHRSDFGPGDRATTCSTLQSRVDTGGEGQAESGSGVMEPAPEVAG